MGMIRIELKGSFGTPRSSEFSALTKGHAAAVAEAIRYLSEEELPRAIENDHRCHAKGIQPSLGYAGTRVVGLK